MPHTSRRKPQDGNQSGTGSPSQRSRRKITISLDGWSTVTTHGGQRQNRNQTAGIADSHNTGPATQDPDLTLETLQARFEATSRKWTESEARGRLVRLLTANDLVVSEPATSQSDIFDRLAGLDLSATTGPAIDTSTSTSTSTAQSRLQSQSRTNTRRHVDKAVILALGSLSSDVGDNTRSRWQLVVFLDMVGILGPPSPDKFVPDPSPIRLFIQEPCLTDLDRRFLETKRITVLRDPAALDMIDEHTLLYITCMEARVEIPYRDRAAARGCAVYTTTDMQSVLERGERALSACRLSNESRAGGDGDAEVERERQAAVELVRSASAVRKSHVEHAFPGHDDYRALPSALYISRRLANRQGDDD